MALAPPNLQPHDLLRTIIRIVRNWPQSFTPDNAYELKCKRPSCVAKLWSRSQVNAENLGKDARYINSDIFYSRIWEDTGQNPSNITHAYPMIGLIEDTNTIKGAFTTNGAQYSVQYNIFVLDRMPEKQTNQPLDPCSNRTWEQAGDNCRSILLTLFQSLSRMEWCQTVVDGDIQPAEWNDPKFLARQQSRGEIDSFETNGVPLASFLGPQNVNGTTMYNVYGDSDVGFFTTITVNFSECVQSYTEIRREKSYGGCDLW